MELMRAFEVRRNGKRLCVAGIDGECVLNTIVNHITRGNGPPDLHLRVIGLISASDEHVIWRTTRLRVGDEITLKIVETNHVDRPRRRYRTDSKQSETNLKAYVRAAAKQFGWKLITSKRSG
jgi:hypothetical protein